MTLELFLLLLMVVSTLTSAVVQGIKKLLDERGKKYHANALAGGVAIVLGILVGIGYFLFIGQAFTVQLLIWLVALVALSWLCAMLGYDKVKQMLLQMKEV